MDFQPTLIEKEEIAALVFPDKEVLSSAEEMRDRIVQLNRAIILGNVEHHKIKIIFEDTTGIKQVETTVWGVTDKRVILKAGLVIPIRRIHRIIV